MVPVSSTLGLPFSYSGNSQPESHFSRRMNEKDKKREKDEKMGKDERREKDEKREKDEDRKGKRTKIEKVAKMTGQKSRRRIRAQDPEECTPVTHINRLIAR
jgi:hypothetical protein